MTSGLTHAVDTVDRAAATPEQPQPFRELGLKDDEYERIREILGRRPTDAELAMYSVMWSEHCSYKSSKVHLRYFGETTTDEMRASMLAGIGENAGVVDIGDGWAATFKVESHNHPSYVEPYQGAATGVGGIVRDIMAMGARPGRGHGPAAVRRRRRARHAPGASTGWCAASAATATRWACPTSAARPCSTRPTPATRWSTRCASGCCAKRTCISRSRRAPATRSSCSARAPVSTASAASPCWRRRLSAATKSGAAGRSCRRCRWATRSPRRCSSSAASSCTPPTWWSASRTSAAPDCPVPLPNSLRQATAACAIELDTVPLRAANMTPAEILSSESQERMCAVVAPENVDAFLAVCRKWEVLATVIGEVTDGDRLQITWHGETVVDVPPRTVAHEGPVYERPVQRPDTQDALNADTSAELPRPSTGEELKATLLALLGSPHLCSRAFITEQYDRYVRGNTVLAEHADGGVLRVDEATGRGIAVSTDASGRYTQLDPYTGAQLALAEAYRNVAVTGATPVAVTNCLNFGSPEDPGVMWQFSQAVRGLADGCAALGIPVTGGNVSFYNQTGTTPILPTPVVGVLGVIDDVKRRIPTGLAPNRARR